MDAPVVAGVTDPRLPASAARDVHVKPPTLVPEAGQVFLVGHGKGVQKYQCTNTNNVIK